METNLLCLNLQSAKDAIAPLFREGLTGKISHLVDREAPNNRYNEYGIPVENALVVTVNGVTIDSINFKLANDTIINTNESLTEALEKGEILFFPDGSKVENLMLTPFVYTVKYYTKSLTNLKTEQVKTSYISNIERINMLQNDNITVVKGDKFTDNFGVNYSIEEVIDLEGVLTQLLCVKY